MTLYVGKDECTVREFRSSVWCVIYLLCCFRPRVHMELRKARKRTLKVREMAEVEEDGACE